MRLYSESRSLSFTRLFLCTRCCKHTCTLTADSGREFSQPQMISISEVRGRGQARNSSEPDLKTGPSHLRPWRQRLWSGGAERPPRRASRGGGRRLNPALNPPVQANRRGQQEARKLEGVPLDRAVCGALSWKGTGLRGILF